MKELPPYESFSSLTAFLECGMRWYLERIARIPEQPAWWQAGGTAVHAATEKYDHEHFERTGR